MPRSFVASNQRERILDAVGQVAAGLGYAEMSVADVTLAAGVSRKTFYQHFHNKEDAFLATYDELSERLLGHVEAAFARATSFGSGVLACVEAFLGFVASEPSFAHTCIVEVLAAGPEAVERRNRTMQVFASLLNRGAVAGVPGRTPPSLMAETLVGGIYEVVYSRVLAGQTAELSGLLPDLAFAVVLPYAGENAAEATARAATERLAVG